MNFKRILWVGICMVGCVGVFGQEVDNQLILEALIHEIADDVPEDFDFSELSERLHYYFKHPINLNETQGDDLAELMFLSAFQVQALLQHRKDTGPFLSVYELQAVEGMDLATIKRLEPFVTLGKPSEVGRQSIGRVLRDGEHDLMIRYARILEQAQGYKIPDTASRSRYLGNADRYLVRYRFQSGRNLRVALNMKKDAGEPFFDAYNKQGFDFYSASVYWQGLGRLQKLVVGDYALQIGQGLSMWTGLSFGKGSLIQNTAKLPIGVKPYTSTNEVDFFRGVAATIAFPKLQITPFVSYKKVDGTLSSGDTISSIGASGYHRTPAEWRNRRSTAQWIYGVDVQFDIGSLKLGAHIYQMHLNAFMLPAERLYNRYYFNGRQLRNGSIYYRYTHQNVYIFGEAAHTFNQGYAFLNGLIASISHDLSVVLLHRHYQKNYQSLFAQGFGESSLPRNENGLYSGLMWNPSRKWNWVAYADYFKFPWLRYRTDGPSQGLDVLTRLTYSPKKKHDFFIHYRYRNKEENIGEGLPMDRVSEVSRHQLRFEARVSPSEWLNLRTKLEWIQYTHTMERGMMVVQDLSCKPMESKLSGNIRMALFKTDGYKARLYAFENDVLYAYSFPAYFNTGVRLYGNLRYRIHRNIDFWARYATFIYQDGPLGSGLDTIEGTLKSELKLQARIQF